MCYQCFDLGPNHLTNQTITNKDFKNWEFHHIDSSKILNIDMAKEIKNSYMEQLNDTNDNNLVDDAQKFEELTKLYVEDLEEESESHVEDEIDIFSSDCEESDDD